MAPPELPLMKQIWTGRPDAKPGCIAWFASGTNKWGWPAAPDAELEFSEPDVCKGKMQASCVRTAFCVAKLLTAKWGTGTGGEINFDLKYDAVEPGVFGLRASPHADAIKTADQVKEKFSQANKVYLVRANLEDGTGHSFVVTSYEAAGALYCGLYMSYARDAKGCGYSLPQFLDFDLPLSPKTDRDIKMDRFTDTFGKLFNSNDVTSEWRTLFKCEPKNPTSLKKEEGVLIKVLDRTVVAQVGFDVSEQLKKQWGDKCPHEY
jgi:hypothetical protein